MLTDKDIDNMSTSVLSRTAANGHIIIGTVQTKYLKEILHWVRDKYRISKVPSIAGIDGYQFKSELQRALTRENIRKNLIDQTSSVSDAASPGPLEKRSQWKNWEEKFENYCKAHIGTAGIPLSYVIRKNNDPLYIDVYLDFITHIISNTPFSGEAHKVDRLTVFNFIVSFPTGQPSGDWIKDTLKYADGRRSMKALRGHFLGKGNASRSMAEAERLRESLHYKSEWSMPFGTFLTQSQKILNIYDQEEPM